MKQIKHIALACLAVAFVGGCGAGSGEPSDALADEKSRKPSTEAALVASQSATNPSTPSVSAAAVTAVPTGRLLASNCFGCHGTNGYPAGGFDRLAGESASEIAGELKEMRTKTDKGIMRVHALGYTDQQIWELATFFASQR